MNCSTKNVQNWFGYQRKLCLRREKAKIASIETEHVSLPVSSSYKKEAIKREAMKRKAIQKEAIKMEKIKKEAEINQKVEEEIKKEIKIVIKKEEPLLCPRSHEPLFPFDMRNFQGNFLPFFKPLYHQIYENKEIINNMHMFNQKILYIQFASK